MIRRVITVSEPTFLSTKDNALVLQRSGTQIAKVPLEDIALLILEGQGITLTTTLMAALALADVSLCVCRPSHLPVAYQLPYPGHTTHPEILRGQIAATKPTRKRLWSCIIRAKLQNSIAVGLAVRGNDGGIRKLLPGLVSGDPTNVEAQAAALFFRLLYGEDFRRDHELDGINALMNYGYAIVRAAVARALVGAGLDLALGIWHHNRSDAYALADDAMEPLRPLVDQLVFHLVVQNRLELDPPTKRELIQVVGAHVHWAGKQMPLLVALEYYAAALREALLQGRKTLACPLL